MFDHGLGGWEIIAILVLFMVLFGAKRLPESARSLGRSMRIFKSAVKGLHADDAQPARVTPQPDAVVQPAGSAAGNGRQRSATRSAPLTVPAAAGRRHGQR